MRILVTGGAGFIGSAFIRKYIKNIEISICNIDSLTYAGNLNSLPDIENLKNYEFHQISIIDEEKIKEILYKFKPQYVLNFAAESHVDRSISNPKIFLETNVIGTYSLLSACLEYYQTLKSEQKNKFKFQHISTDEVYGDIEINAPGASEDSNYQPSSPYSASKASSDHLVNAWYRTYKLPISITNCSNNYGPFQFPEKFIPNSIISLINGEKVPIYGKGTQIRDWLYVDDHVEAIFEVLCYGDIGETFNIGGDCEMKNTDVLDSIIQHINFLKKPSEEKIQLKNCIEFVQDRPGHDKRYSIDCSKIKSKLNWKQNETFKTGINKTVEWYINNEKWWKDILSRDCHHLNGKDLN